MPFENCSLFVSLLVEVFKSIYLSILSEVYNEIRGSRVLQYVGNYHQTTRRHIPEDCILHAHPHGSLKLLISH
jgi:hypothetical protein